jgi:CheY-like chemotaxis protein
MSGARILVADDQIDVARTLCGPLRNAGARLRFVSDGHAALDEITKRPYDLILVDMKMPPEEWGGVWLLQRLGQDEWRIPTLVLSGEGTKRQVIEALRLGAMDWIDKEAANTELPNRCARLLSESLDRSFELASTRLPTPLAFRFARYARIADHDKEVTEGLHTLEAIFRFAAALGLSHPAPTPLAGITAREISRPSMGTWYTLCSSLSQIVDSSTHFGRILSALIPESGDRQAVQSFITIRNDLAHGRATPNHSVRDSLDLLLRRFAHRAASSWRASLSVPTSMTYDGSRYALDVLNFAGAGKPSPAVVHTEKPQVTGQMLLIPDGELPVSLFPWLVAETASPSGELRCLQFDGVQRSQGSLQPSTGLRYAKSDEGEDLAPTGYNSGTWQALSPWIR